MPQDQLLQRGTVAVLDLLDQVDIGHIAIGNLGEGVDHESAPLSAGLAIPDEWNNVQSLGPG
jgi:hypothetical protein